MVEYEQMVYRRESPLALHFGGTMTEQDNQTFAQPLKGRDSLEVARDGEQHIKKAATKAIEALQHLPAHLRDKYQSQTAEAQRLFETGLSGALDMTAIDKMTKDIEAQCKVLEDTAKDAEAKEQAAKALELSVLGLFAALKIEGPQKEQDTNNLGALVATLLPGNIMEASAKEKNDKFQNPSRSGLFS